MKYKPRHAFPGLGAIASLGARTAVVSAVAAGAAGAVVMGGAPANAVNIPVTPTLSACGQGSSAIWNSGNNAVLTAGTASPGTCGAPAGSTYDPAYAELTVTGAAGAPVPTIEPSFDASTYSAGDPRFVVELSNGHSLWGYPPESGLNGTDMAWAVDNGNTYTDYATALASADVDSSTTVTSAYIVDDTTLQGDAVTLTNATYNGTPLMDSGVSTVSSRGEIKNAYSGKCMDVTGGVFTAGTLVQQWTCGAKAPDGTAGGDQQFQFTTYTNGSVHNGYLEAISPSGQIFYVTPDGSGQQMQLWTSPTANNDMAKSGPYYTFPNSDVVADDDGWSQSNGAEVIGYAQNDGANQQWSMP
jgi:hypothetical protein